jgi:hypothetical protein
VSVRAQGFFIHLIHAEKNWRHLSMPYSHITDCLLCIFDHAFPTIGRIGHIGCIGLFDTKNGATDAYLPNILNHYVFFSG